jgi:TRAP-type C4-dicarboxylate transport system substrate-binding protein
MRRLVVALLALLVAFPAAAQPIAWTVPTEYPANAMPGEGLRHFAETLKQTSGGRIEVTPSFDAAMGLKSADMVKAVAADRVPAADAFAPALNDTHQIFLVSALPFLAVTIPEAKLLYEVTRPAYEKALAAHDQILLYATPWPASGIWAKKPITAPADLAGLSIRTYDATSASVLKAAGAAPTLLSFADAMPRLRDGSVQAVLSSGDGGAGRRLWEFLPHFTEINYAMPLSIATMRRGVVDALPAELRQAVKDAAAETERHQWRLIETRLAENYARMRANGVVITTAIGGDLAAVFARSAASAIDAWAQQAGPGEAAILAEFRRRAGKS